MPERRKGLELSLRQYLVGQFRQPHGPLGQVAGWIMLWRGSNRQRNLWTLDLLDVEPGHRVLEIGFGPAYAIEQLLRRCPEAHVTGLDHSEAMLGQASRRLRQEILDGRVELSCDTVEGLGSWERTFDRVYSSNVVQFWPDRRKALEMILNSLAPGGRVVTTYLPRNPQASDQDAVALGEALAKEMREVGFRNVSLEPGPRLPVLTVSVVGTRSLDPSD